MLLRDVEPGDVAAYVRMRCDPVMMAELGGPQPRDGVQDKVRRDAAEAAAGTSLIKVIIPDPAAPAVVAGSLAARSGPTTGSSTRERISADRQRLLEPVVSVMLVAERGHLAVPSRPVQADRLGERAVGLQPDHAGSGRRRVRLQPG